MVNLTVEIAELLGAHVGDGTLYQTSRGVVWELRGDLFERDYYRYNICPLLKSVLDVNFDSKYRSGGAHGVWGVQTSNKKLINLFLEFGFLPGKKAFTVSIPLVIISADISVKLAFVRGLFDTDGCLRFDRLKKKELRTFPRLEITTVSLRLKEQLFVLLVDLGYHPILWRDRNSFRISVTGKVALERWMSEINPKNPKHLKKYYFWKQNGFY